MIFEIKFLNIESSRFDFEYVFKCLAKAFRSKVTYFEKWTPSVFGVMNIYIFVIYIYMVYVVGPVTIGRSIAQ